MREQGAGAGAGPEPATCEDGTDSGAGFNFTDEEGDPLAVDALSCGGGAEAQWQQAYYETLLPGQSLASKAVMSSPDETRWRSGAQEANWTPLQSGPPGSDPSGLGPLMTRQRRPRSVGPFVALFVATALLFGALALVVAGAPQTSAEFVSRIPAIAKWFENPAAPATLVKLSEIHADYRRLKNGRRALVVTGSARNAAGYGLHTVEIAVGLLDLNRREIARRSTYCGNPISPTMIDEMTPRELQFVQTLDPQKDFVLRAGESVPFVLVFTDLPAGVKNLKLSVLKAEAARQSKKVASRW